MRVPGATHSGQEPSTLPASRRSTSDGRLGRLGRWAGGHRRIVVLVWAGLLICLGVLAPRAEHALSGGGWQADGSQSVQARQLIDRHFQGQGSYALVVVVSSRRQTADSQGFRATIGRVVGLLRRDPAVGAVTSPPAAGSVAPGGRVAVVRGGAAAGPAEMVRAASRLREPPRGGGGAWNRRLAHRLGRTVVGIQRSEQGRDAALRGDVVAGHAGCARGCLRVPRRSRDPAAACCARADCYRRHALDREPSSLQSRSGR